MSDAPTASRPNRLAKASSPYLRQHAYNPVDWYPWGPEALQRARQENRPILLSVGYSACHWCHVMAHESFEDPEIARLMNEHFVCVKVDREERPDIDQVYQFVCQLTTGQGGWPLTVFLTPDLEPFYVGTYFPPQPRFGRPGFAQVLQACARAWREQEPEIRAHARRLAEAARMALHPPLSRAAGMPAAADEGPAAARPEGTEAAGPGGRAWQVPGAAAEPSARYLVLASTQLLAQSDPDAGGFGTAPKFPHPTGLELLLRAAWRFGHEDALSHLMTTLERMAWGGIFDHVGGGFHRYAVDRWWQVPHFEKMLYDNALLVPLYVRAGLWQNPQLLEVARRTLDFLLEEMRLPDGGFAASLDADSLDGAGRPAEGFFYRWTPEEVQQAVGDGDLARLVCQTFAIGSPEPYPHARLAAEGPPGWAEEAPTVVGRMPPQPPAGLDDRRREQLRQALLRMKAYRKARRAPPGRDEKVVLAWHALALSALAAGCQCDPGPQTAPYREAALAGWQFVDERMRHPRWGLLHTAGGAGEEAIPAFADDYAALIHAALDLYRLTLDRALLSAAGELAEQARRKFAEADGVYCLSSAEHGSPLTRSRDVWDQALPSPNALMAAAHARLAALLDDPSHLEAGRRIVAAFWPVMLQHVSATAGLWCALDRLDEGTTTVRLLAPAVEGLRGSLAQLLRLPHPSLELSWQADAPPPRWVVCTGTVCRPPEADLEPVLSRLGPARR